MILISKRANIEELSNYRPIFLIFLLFTLAMFAFLERGFDGLDNGQAVAAVFCDLSKAFDYVSHDVLLRKLDLTQPTEDFHSAIFPTAFELRSGRYDK